MLILFAKAPLYIWPLLAYLIFSGLKASKTGKVPMKLFLIIPSIFLSWSTYTILTRYGLEPITLCCWLAAILIGACIGLAIAYRLQVKFDTIAKTVEVPGSWMTLACSMTIFCSKFSIGMMAALQPAWIGTPVMLIPELIAAVATGVFLGRSIGFFRRYKAVSSNQITVV